MISENQGAHHEVSADSLAQLEFAKVVNLVVGRTQTPYGRALAAALLPHKDREPILDALQEAEEAVTLIRQDGPLARAIGMRQRAGRPFSSPRYPLLAGRPHRPRHAPRRALPERRQAASGSAVAQRLSPAEWLGLHSPRPENSLWRIEHVGRLPPP